MSLLLPKEFHLRLIKFNDPQIKPVLFSGAIIESGNI